MVPDGWRVLELGELAKFTSGGTPSKSNESYWGGNHPWISGKDLKQHYLSTSIDSLTDEGFSSANKAPAGSTLVLVRGMTLLKDFPVGFATKPLAFNQDLKALIPEKNVDGLFLSFLLAGNKEKIRQLVSTAGHGTGRLDTESLKAFPVLTPKPLEQKKIAKILSTWDQAITTTEQILKSSRQQKKALMQQLLIGKRRLSGYQRPWTMFKLEQLFSRVTTKNTEINTNVVTISAQHGLIRQEDFFNKTIASEILDNYFLLKKGQFAYNKSYSNGYPMGAIKRLNKYEKGVVTTLYICFEASNETKCNPEFFEHYFESGRLNNGLSKIANEGGRAHGLLNVKPSDFFGLTVFVPEVAEQKAIATVLNTADQEIQTLQIKLSSLRDQKKSLMQQLLTGKRRVKVDHLELI
jgi:type I restriction enzyme S subunit